MTSHPRSTSTAPPAWIAVPAAIALAVAVIPVVALAMRVPWARVPELVASEAGAAALGLSLRTSLVSAVIVIAVGIPLAVLMARARRWSGALRVAVVLPMTMPPVVGGLALLAAFGRTGVVGSRWPWLAQVFSFSTAAVVLAQVFVSLPFLVLAVEGAVRGLDPRHAEAAAGLGASRSRILWHVTLPMVLPAIVSGATLSLARALGEFGATLTFAGSLPGVTRTLPLAIYLERENDPDLALALAAVLLAIAIVLVAVGAAVPWWLGRRGHRGRGTDSPAAVEVGADGGEVGVVKQLRAGGDLAVSVTVPGVLDARATVPAGRTTAVIGPNGAGKSTLVRALAGLPVHGPASVGGGIACAVLLTQDPALLPHRTVLGNVEFACGDRDRARRELAAIGVAHLADRRPASLSGGQASRVALARALAADTDAILLDEPFAALDAASAAALRGVLHRRLRGRTTLLVTHDPVDVATLADHAIVIEDGRIAAAGAPADLLAAPATPFLAQFAGLVAVRGTARVLDDATIAVLTPAGTELTGVARGDIGSGDTVVGLFSPRSVTLHAAGEGSRESSARNDIECTVRAIHHQGSSVGVELGAVDGETVIIAEISAHSLATLRLAEGMPVRAAVKAMQVQVLPAAR
ncbi:molybdate ABC transporter permease subunit [Corynebacterium sp. NPDC060344]|uniref:molybdate ABC transporter permease subunit n=1 Tax=Corynebacterium sp. NPDC060344 TaxID=3347101 RepID=UPI00364E8F98